MAFRRRLSDHQMIAVRWEYEVTAISERNLAAKWGVSRSAIHAWITKHGWSKAEVLWSYEGEEGQRQLQCDVHAAIAVDSSKTIIQALDYAIAFPPAARFAKVTKVTKGDTPGKAARTAIGVARKIAADRPHASQNAPSAEPPGRRRAGYQDGQVVRFPGASLPPQGPKTHPDSAFPARSRTEQAATRVGLSLRRGEPALQQIQQLEQHDALLRAYQHLLEAYLNPLKFIEVSGLDPAQAAARVEAMRQQAARLLMPTKRDSLTGVIRALSKAVLAGSAAQRNAAGTTPRRRNGRTVPDDQDEQEAPLDLSTLDTPSLRLIATATALLRGAAQRHDAEPPKPPPPESLDDRVVRRPLPDA